MVGLSAKHWAGIGGLLAAVLAGCSVDVDVGFQCQDDTGNTRESGATFDVGCKKCECLGDGTIQCDESDCFCQAQGGVFPVGEPFTAPDGCNTCTCDEKGGVSCTEEACGCEGDPPPCAEPAGGGGCWIELVCTDQFEWECVETCSCDGPPPPDCPPLAPGCFYNGPVCEDGQWACGEVFCDDPCALEPPPCDQPGEPNCFGQPECTDMGWECFYYCDQCGGPMPECGPDAFAECTEFGNWECFPFNSTCGEVTIACEPWGGQECSQYPVCHADGTWNCQDDCDPALCVDVPPDCPVGDPACWYYAACTPNGQWQCAESCQ